MYVCMYEPRSSDRLRKIMGRERVIEEKFLEKSKLWKCFKHRSIFIAFRPNNLYAVSIQAPPTFLIFSSAILLKNLAFTTTGCFGSEPFPSTLK